MKDSTGNMLLSIPAVVFSIIAIAISCPRSQELNFDYYGIVFTILSVLITLLIGWNIIQAVKLDKKMGEVKLTHEKSEENLRKVETISNNNSIVTELHFAYTQAELLRYAGKYLSAFKNYIEVIYCYEIISVEIRNTVSNIRDLAIYGIDLIFKCLNKDKMHGERVISDIDLECDSDFLKYRGRLQNNDDCIGYFKKIDSYLFGFLSKPFGGVFFKLFQGSVFINYRPHTIFLLINNKMSPIIMCFDSNIVNRETAGDVGDKCEYIGIYSYVNLLEKETVVDNIKRTYKDIIIK